MAFGATGGRSLLLSLVAGRRAHLSGLLLSLLPASRWPALRLHLLPASRWPALSRLGTLLLLQALLPPWVSYAPALHLDAP